MLLVLGGGLSGLSAAFYARQCLLSASVHLIEASSQLGGWVRSSRASDGIVFEHGPHTIRPVGDNGVNTLNLIEDLGIADMVKPILRENPAAQVRLIYSQGKLHALPSSLLSLFRNQAPFSQPIATSLLKDIQAQSKQCEDDSAYDFFERRLGHEVADLAISPLIRGVCAGNAHEITVKMLFRTLFEAEQKHGSICKGMLKKLISQILIPQKSFVVAGKLALKSRLEKWSVYSLSNGLQTLPETIESKLRLTNTKITLNDKCAKLNFDSTGATVILESGSKLQAKEIICSLPASELGKLVNEQHPKLGMMLTQLRNATVCVVNFRFPGNILKQPAFGFLVPLSENVPLLGVIYYSSCFPNPTGDTVLSVMMGGHCFHPQFTKCNSEELAQIASDCIKKIMDIEVEPSDQKASILKNCIPQYTVGHYERVKDIHTYIKEKNLPLHLVGSSYNGIGINDVIMSARNAINSLKCGETCI